MPLAFPIGRAATLALAIGALSLLGAGCSSPAPSSGMGRSSGAAAGGSAASSGTEVRVTTTEFKFAPGALQVPSGKAVNLVLDNKGALEHDMMVTDLGIHLRADPHQVTQTSATFSKPGTYAFECTIPGHKEAGMKGTIQVQ
ncbi:MAG: cupredoxin domain-containing protein [Chloroflexi bacterium]|nr:cupredoxin domain-containing protein [Chloroflexota bacterium]